MKIYQVLIVIVIIAGIYVRFFAPKKSEPIKTDNSAKEAAVERYIDSLNSEILKLRNQKPQVQIIYKNYVKTSDKINSLYADSTLLLFASWNRQLQDSSYKTRYFRLSSDTIH